MKEWRRVVRAKTGRTFINMRIAEMNSLGISPTDSVLYNTEIDTEKKIVIVKFRHPDGSPITLPELLKNAPMDDEEAEKEGKVSPKETNKDKVKLEDILDIDFLR